MLRISHCLDNRPRDGSKVVGLTLLPRQQNVTQEIMIFLFQKSDRSWHEFMAKCFRRVYFLHFLPYYPDRLCGLMVRVPGYRTEMYCVSCAVRTEFIYVM
jgi:hypothetical protein